MRDKKKFVFFPALFMLLAGCGGGTKTSSSVQPSLSDKPSEQEINQTPHETPSSGSAKTDTSGTGSTSKSETQKALWDKGTQNRRKLHFDGFLIPYVDIGKGYDTEWNDGTSKATTYRSITGDKFDGTKIAGFKTTYLAEGWTQTKDTSLSIIFEKEAYKVEITKSSDGLFLIKAYYNVVFDASKAPGKWDEDTQNELDTDFPGLTLPYLYLGSPTCYATFSSASRARTIYGYTFNASILETAKTTFTADGWTVKEASDSNGPALSITKTFDNAQLLTVTIKTSSSTATSRYSIKVQLTENWDGDLFTDWDATLKQEFIDNCDGHVPTFFYLGTGTPDYTYKDSCYQFVLTGGTYDARTIPHIKTSLENDKTRKWTITRNGNNLIARTEIEDGCRFIIQVLESSGNPGKTKANIYYIPKRTVPSTAATDWDEATKQQRKEAFGQTIPYIYLGEDDIKCTYAASYAKRTIRTVNTGTFVSSNLIYNAAKVLSEAGWSITWKLVSNGDELHAFKDLDSGDKMGIILSPEKNTSYANLYVQRYEKYDDSYVGAWNTNRSLSNQTGKDTSSTEYQMTQNFGGHKFPYVYLGTKRHSSAWDATSGSRTIYGGQWDKKTLAKVKTVLEADTPEEGDSTWTLQLNNDDVSEATSLTATKAFADGCAFTVSINKPYSSGTGNSPISVTKRIITYRTKWGTTQTDWADNIKTTITKAGFPSADLIPYVYLGTDTPTAKNGTSYQAKKVTFTGTAFDNRVLDEFDKSRANAGWTLSNEKNIRCGKETHAAIKYIYDDSGVVTAARRATIYRATNNSSGKATRAVYYDDASVASKDRSAAWTDDQKTLRKTYLGGTDEAILPSFNRGAQATVAYNTGNGGYIDIKTDNKDKKFKSNYFNWFNNKTILDGTGWTTDLSIFVSPTADSGLTKLSATKTVSTGTMKLEVVNYSNQYNSGIEIKVFFHENYAPTTGENAKWSASNRNFRTEHRNGYIIPYFYRGSKDPLLTRKTPSSASNQIGYFMGSTWDDSIVTNRKTALASDKAVKDWTFVNDYSKMNRYGFPITIASGTQVITTPAVYDDDGTTIITPEKTETHYITLRLYKDAESNGERPILDVYYF